MSEVRKSPSDPRVYAYCTLPNAIRCLVVSDAETEKSAAAVSVACGSLQDPKEVQGLSHFLEHMLFLGTEKYPEENTYRAFVKAHGGNFNAFTALEETNFYFCISPENFHSALDIFSQFFISPSLTPSCVSRELNAVDSEHQKNRQTDQSRLNQLIYSLAKSDHPYNHFPTGRIDTLQRPDIRDFLLSHYAQFYSSDAMTLVLYGKEPAEVLIQWALDLFSPIPNKSRQQLPISPEVFPSENLCTVTRVVSVMDRKELKIVWTLPSMQERYTTKPHLYLSHLIGHEGKHSVLSMLKKQGLAHGLSAGLRTSHRSFSLFSVSISLTEKGLAQWESVLEVLFSYISMLRETGPQEWVFQEIKAIFEAEFRFKSKESAMQYTSTLAGSLHKHKPEDVLTAMNLVEEYNAVEIREVLDCLQVENALFFLLSQDENPLCSMREPWYQTAFVTSPISPAFLETLKSPHYTDSDLRLDYPPRNHFLPTKFELLEDEKVTIPLLVGSFPGVSVRYMRDTSFRKDSVCALAYIKCGDAGYWSTALGFLCAKVWLRMLQDSIAEDTYMASQAGFEFAIALEPLGVTVTVSGFSQHFEDFVGEMIGKIAAFRVTEADEVKFAEHFAEVSRTLQNAKFLQPHIQAKARLQDLLCANLHHTNESQLREVPLVTLPDLVFFSRKWLQCTRTDWLFIGNFTESAALSVASNSARSLQSQVRPLSETEVPARLRYSLPSRSLSHIALQSNLQDTTNNNSVALVFWEHEVETLPAKAALQVIESVFKEPCFSFLRTQLQLGYIVFSANKTSRRVIGHYLLVQSHRFPPRQLSQYISEFIAKMTIVIAELPDEEFIKHKQSVLGNVMQKDIALEKRFQRLVKEMMRERYCFDRREQVAKAVEECTKADVQSLFTSLFHTDLKRIDIELISNSHISAHQSLCASSPSITYTSIPALQRTLSLHPAS